MQRNSGNSLAECLNVSRSDKFEEDTEKFVPLSDVMKLKLEDKNLFGYCPEYEDFYLVICKFCGRSLKPQSLMSHIELRHSKNKLSFSETLQDSLISNPTSNCSNEKSRSNDDSVLKNNSIYSLSGSREKFKVMSNKKQNVYVQPYLRSSSEINCQNKNTNKFTSCKLSSESVKTSLKPKTDYNEYLKNRACVTKEVSCQKNVGKLNSFIPSSDIFQTTLTRHIAPRNDPSESLSNEVYVTKESSLATSSSTCDSQTSMTVFLHHSFVMPNIKLCDIKDEHNSHHQSVTCKTLPKTTFLAQVLPVKRGRPSIRSLRQSSQVHQNSGEVNNWSNIHENSNLALNGVSYSAWNQHTHFHSLPHSVPISNSGQMDSFNCSELTKRFGDIESQVLIHNAAMGT